MVFTVLVAVDLAGKCNYELAFPSLPTINELRATIDETLAAEALIRRAPQAGQFRVHRAQVFDERMEMWVDLVASSQLEDYIQIYIFQKETVYHKDTPGRIPPPMKPVGASSPMYRRSASPPQFETHNAPLYADLAASPLQGAGSPYMPVVAGVSPARTHYHQDAYSPLHAAALAEQRDAASVPPALEPTMSEKVRSVFDEMNVSRSRTVTPEEWSEFYAKVRLAGDDNDKLTGATVDDLFTEKADRNEDNLVSFPEFQQFADVYPKLVDALYFRAKKVGKEKVRADRMEALYAQQDALEKNLDGARQAALDAESEGLTTQQNLDDLAQQVEDAKDSEKAAADARNDAHKATEDVRGSVRQAKQEEAAAKDVVKKRDVAKRTETRKVEIAEKKADAQNKELEKLNRELEALRKRLADKENEIMKQTEAMQAADMDVDAAKQKALEADDTQPDEDLKNKQDATKAAEDELKEALAAENEQAGALRAAQRETADLQHKQAQLEKENAGQKAKEAQKKAAEDRAEKVLDDHKKAVERNEAREADEAAKAEEEERKENELLSLEVRLREQRDAVEKKEEHLRSAHAEFSAESGRAGSPGRGY